MTPHTHARDRRCWKSSDIEAKPALRNEAFEIYLNSCRAMLTEVHIELRKDERPNSTKFEEAWKIYETLVSGRWSSKFSLPTQTLERTLVRLTSRPQARRWWSSLTETIRFHVPTMRRVRGLPRNGRRFPSVEQRSAEFQLRDYDRV